MAQVIQASDGQALVAMRENPGTAAAVPAVEQAFTDATRTAGLLAAAFIGLGLLFSLRLPAPTRQVVPTTRSSRGRILAEPVMAE